MNKTVFLFFMIIITVCILCSIGCAVPEKSKKNSSSKDKNDKTITDTDTDTDTTINMWTWVSGSDTVNQSGSYGTKWTPADTNIPGARYNSISWIDSSGKLWLFGGHGYDKNGNYRYLNDLWKYDGSNWTWMSGSDWVDQSGSYGTKGTPGARQSSISWIDSSGNLWLFVGHGRDKKRQ